MTAPAVLLVEWSPGRPHRSRRRRAHRRFVALVVALAVVTVAMPAWAVTDVLRWAGADDRTPTDAIVVLGAAQYQGAPSPVLANRLAHALELVEAGVSDRVITVGGFQPGDITSEAQTGKEELVADGMRRAQVIALPFGENTDESLKAVAAIVRSEGLGSVTLVTDPGALRPRTRPRRKVRPGCARLGHQGWTGDDGDQRSTCCANPLASSRSGSPASTERPAEASILAVTQPRFSAIDANSLSSTVLPCPSRSPDSAGLRTPKPSPQRSTGTWNARSC